MVDTIYKYNFPPELDEKMLNEEFEKNKIKDFSICQWYGSGWYRCQQLENILVVRMYMNCSIILPIKKNRK